MRTKTTLALCVLAASLGGCLYPAERGRMLEERLDRLEADKKDLEQDLKKQKAKLEEQITQVLGTLEKVEKSTNKTGADVTAQVEQLQSELASLRGQLEQFGHQAGELASAFDKLKSATPPPPPEPVADAKDGKEGKDGKKPEDKPKPPERPADRKGFAELVEKTCAEEPAGCRKIADEWLRKFNRPDAAAEVKGWAPLAARVHYALGSSFMDQKEPRAALSEFGEIVKNHGKSEQASDALLKSADCFAALKMVEESRLALEEIVNSYPKSEAAKAAKTKLAELKKPKKKK
ncbi:MAG TPA: tetratricopeptide repeat protein [Myxococcales bacterium]|jgi:tetratricopeptide (TPR) repeat protein